jgi:hypothetical protein
MRQNIQRLILGLEAAMDHKVEHIEESKEIRISVVNQVLGAWQVKTPTLVTSEIKGRITLLEISETTASAYTTRTK